MFLSFFFFCSSKPSGCTPHWSISSQWDAGCSQKEAASSFTKRQSNMAQQSRTVIPSTTTFQCSMFLPCAPRPERFVEHMSLTALIHVLNFPEHTQASAFIVSAAHVIRKSRLTHSLGLSGVQTHFCHMSQWIKITAFFLQNKHFILFYQKE